MAPIGNLKGGFLSASNYAEVGTKLDMVNYPHIPKPSTSPFLGSGTQGELERGSRKESTNSVIEAEIFTWAPGGEPEKSGPIWGP